MIKGIADYMWSMTTKDGGLYCPKHTVEHTGKNAYAAILEIEIHKRNKMEEYKRRALLRLNHIIDEHYGTEPNYNYPHFLPGTSHPRANINNIIDGGCCIDALCEAMKVFKDELSAKTTEKFESVVESHISQYLAINRYKGKIVTCIIPNQRLWGATGVANASTMELGDEEWKEAVVVSLNKTINEMWEDGAFPYIPRAVDQGNHPGLEDISPYYHSRHAVFLHYCAQHLNMFEKHRLSFLKSCDFLINMLSPAGEKAWFLENKNFYWDSPYEVSSYSYDIYALLKAFNLTNDVKYGYYAKKLYKFLQLHRGEDGGIEEIKPKSGINFQCRLFWNSHFVWLARCLDDLESVLNKEFELPLGIEQSSNVDLYKSLNDNFCLILRGRKKPSSNCFGPKVGGGSIGHLSLRFAKFWSRNLMHFSNMTPFLSHGILFHQRNNLLQKIVNLTKLRKKNVVTCIRQRFHVARVFLSSENIPKVNVIRYLIYHISDILRNENKIGSSSWCPEAKLKTSNNKIIVKGSICKRNGEKIAGLMFLRKFKVLNSKIIIEDKIFLRRKKTNDIVGLSIPLNIKKKSIVKNAVSFQHHISIKSTPIEVKFQEFPLKIIFKEIKASSHRTLASNLIINQGHIFLDLSKEILPKNSWLKIIYEMAF